MPSIPYGGRTVVAAAGTPVALNAADDSECLSVIITALDTNTNPVAVGGSGSVSAAAGNQQGILLKPTSDPLRLDMVRLDQIFVDARTSGEGVSYTYIR